MHDARRELLTSFLIFVASALIGVLSAANDPDFVRLILGNGYVDMTLDNIANDETLKDPYVLIRNLKKSCTGLRDVTSDYESRMWLDSLLRNVDTLKNRVDDIAENV